MMRAFTLLITLFVIGCLPDKAAIAITATIASVFFIIGTLITFGLLLMGILTFWDTTSGRAQ